MKLSYPYSRDPSEANREFFSNKTVVSFYSTYNELTAAELAIFDEFVAPRSKILDLGVGGGRTTPYLTAKACRYVGIDTSSEMVEACQRKFPGHEFRIMDASDLSAFSNEAFDVVVFSYNGIDCLHPQIQRWRCIAECHRVLKIGGIFILSVHNPRSLFVRPDTLLITRRLHGLPGISGLNPQLSRLAVGTLLIPSVIWVIMKTIFYRSSKRLCSSIWWRGEGYLNDEVNPGTIVHAATPRRVEKELANFGFEVLKVLGGSYPTKSSMLSTGWFYYSALKTPLHKFPAVEVRSE
jgi:SAM-dependent methyltransferase